MVDKVRENRARRAVARRGYQLRKTRRRDPRAYDYQTYEVRDPHANVGEQVVWGFPFRGFGLSLDDVEAWLEKEDS